ncbi:MAG: tyrosine-type recombinase/integrase [Planctomyces sp.]|nr:tyrosine-type recombinase/integrase [Planctomyces sp.]
MASVSTCKRTGLQRLLFRLPDGSRTAFYAGRVDYDSLVRAGTHIDQLVECWRTNDIPRRATREWLENVDRELPALARRLRRLGLIGGVFQPDVSVAEFATSYLRMRSDARPSTQRNWRQSAAIIAEFFEGRTLRKLVPADGKEFLRWLKRSKSDGGRNYLPTTAARHFTFARALLQEAVDRTIIASNPFQKISVERRSPQRRRVFIDESVIRQLILATDDPELKVLLALSRWGGLRTPSEPYALKWSDIDWTQRRILVHCIKTETRGKPTREIPLFPELVEPLKELKAIQNSESPDAAIIQKWAVRPHPTLRKTVSQLIVKNAHALWPRLFQSLRSSRQTELEERFPRKTVCEWMGNTESVADKHYLMVRQEHFDKACQEDALTSVWYSC